MRRRCSRRSRRAACVPPALIPWAASCSKATRPSCLLSRRSGCRRCWTAIRETCQPRTRYLLPVDELSFLGGRSRDVESVQVGGATVFELPVLRFEGLADPEPADRPALPDAATMDAPHMLVAAIVHSASAGTCLQALLEAGYRVTRINTVGGFLRRGYPALLTGVTPDQVDHAVGLLRQACRQRSADSTPGIAFVLPVAPFLQV